MNEKNYVLSRITYYLQLKSWTLYRLARESNIPYSSLHSMFEKNTQPTISTLEKICSGLHISLSDFFSNKSTGGFLVLTEEEENLIHLYRSLNSVDKTMLLSISHRLANEKGLSENK